MYIYIYIIFVIPNKNIYNFFQESKSLVSENINFLIKFIYNILCIIKNYIKSENFLLVLNKLSQTINFLPHNQKHQETYLKINKTQQNYNSKK